MIYLKLFLEFFKIGLFSIGGGYATMPFLYEIAQNKMWYSMKELSDMVAISVITPGPVGINMATFAGFKTAKITGALIASLSLIIPSFIITILVFKLLKKYEENFYVKTILYALKPTACGLLTAVCVNFFKDGINNLASFLIFIILFSISFYFKKNPFIYFFLGAILGIIIKHFNFLL